VTRGYVQLALRTPTLPPAHRTNCYVVGHHDAIVVDPGSSFRPELNRLLAYLWERRGKGDGLQAVVVTHHHGDHVGGAVRLARELDLPLAAHPETLARLSAQTVRTQALVDGQRLRTDPQLELVCLHTPGHTPGHLCLFELARRILVGGDMVPGDGTTLVNPPDGDMVAYLASLERLVALRPAMILPGHGPTLEDGTAAVKRLVAHRLWREGRVLAALRPSWSEQDLWTVTLRAYEEIPAWLLPLASRSALAHLIKLEREGRAHQVSTGRWTVTSG
jgi:ribonuclease/clavin/mitogillin